MRPWQRWLYVIAGLAAAIVAAVQAIREASWAPVVSVAWLPAVIAATWPGSYRRCLCRRRTPAG